MAMFSPILSLGELPAPGASRERYSLDFKARGAYKNGSDREEMAKDVVALANASGGTILCGAEEEVDQRGKLTGVLKQYNPIPEVDGNGLLSTFDLVNRDQCSPSPLLHGVPIPYRGGVIVAVNVWPSPLLFVGMRVVHPPSKDVPQTYRFPLRVGTQTAFLEAGQLAMFMLPETRRAAILLDAIPLDAKVRVTSEGDLWTGVNASVHWDECTFRHLGANPLKNSCRLRLQDHHSTVLESVLPSGTVARGIEGTIPLDAVRSVWEDGRPDEPWWTIALVGSIHISQARLLYSPRPHRG